LLQLRLIADDCVHVMTNKILFLSIFAAALLSAHAALNDRPVIGIMVQPLDPKNPRDMPLLKYGSMYLPRSYVDFVEAAGARAAPVLYNGTEKEHAALFKDLSGLLIPGGHCGFHNTVYGNATDDLLNLAKKANAAGDVFAVHGVCQGFQQLAQWASGSTRNILGKFDAEDVLLPLEPPIGTKQWPPAWSWLLGKAPEEVSRVLSEQKSTVNLHHLGISTELFAPGHILDNGVFRVTAISRNGSGVPFVSLMEGSTLPFSGSQYHPEKNAYEFGGLWNQDADIGVVHSDKAIAASQWLARQFVAHARQSSHRWSADTEFPLIRDFDPLPGDSNSGFDWESCYFWGPKSQEGAASVVV